MTLSGQLAVVTGATRGIGAALATGLATVGARVVRLARHVPGGATGGFVDFACDVTDASAVERVAARILSELGTPDLVVNNAGVFLLRALEQTDPTDFDRQLAVNLRGPYLIARAFLPSLRQAGRGLWVTLGSVADHLGLPENAAYAASKYGVRGLHETLAAEYSGSGVRFTLISPGPTDTGAWDPFDPDHRPGFPARAAMLRPSDVADAVLFVATRPARVRVELVRLGPA